MISKRIKRSSDLHSFCHSNTKKRKLSDRNQLNNTSISNTSNNNTGYREIKIVFLIKTFSPFSFFRRHIQIGFKFLMQIKGIIIIMFNRKIDNTYN
nr:MAG TPA: hypothetical protein [Microviridae sp.]